MLSLLLLLTPMAQPTAKPAPGANADEQIHKYLAAEAARLSQRFMDGAKTKAEWEAKRPRLKQEFLDMVGLWPLPERTPLKATVTGTLERGDVVVEKLHYQSKPGLYVTGNLYRPKSNDKKLPAILYVCGHSGRGRDGNKTAFQDHGLWFALNGYVCLVVDTLQLGEVAGKHHGTYNLNRFWWQSRGYTPAGVECWNGMRGIDYLCSRPDVDPDRIGVTGISGGGATTVWVAAADDRVKVAVPVSGMSDLESYVTNKVINGHCDCMFFINTYQWEWTTALALHAPKPLLFANSDNDPIFPMDGNRRIMARLNKCYEMLGQKENVAEYVSKGNHDYRPDLRVAIFGFLNKHLKGATGTVKDAESPGIAGKDLRVFPEDKDLPKDQINDRIDESFVPTAEVKLPTNKEEFVAWKAATIKRLREVSFRAMPDKVSGADLRVENDAFQFRTGDGLDCTVQVLDFGKSKKKFAFAPETHFVLNPSEDASDAWKQWAKAIQADNAFLAVWLRGTGPGQWTRKNPPNTVERSLALLGQTVDGGRVRDLASYAIGFEADNALVGRGPAGLLATFGAVFANAKKPKVLVLDPPTSFRDGPHLLNIQRVLDVPEAFGLLAPDVKLTLIGASAKDKAFDRTAAIYKAAGAADKFVRE